MLAHRYNFLKRYVEKYPDRLGLVNVIAAVYDLGALDQALLDILVENTRRVCKLSGLKDSLDARTTTFGKRRRRTAVVEDSDDDEDQVEAAKPVQVRKPSEKIHIVYGLLKTHGQVSVSDLVGKYGLYKSGMSVMSGANSMSQVRKLLQPDEVLLSFDQGPTDRIYQLKKR